MRKLILLLALMIPLQANAGTMSSMGLCKITYYCSCFICSGPYGDLTATGTRCQEGRTVAVDPSVIAYGTKLLIDGHVYTAEDCGGNVRGDHVDIYLDGHAGTKEDPDPICCDYYSEIPRQMKIIQIIGSNF